MSFIRTVLGDIFAAQLGVCYAHEHIIIDRSFPTHEDPSFLLDSVDAAAAELRELYALGGRAVIDSMPCDSGRNILKLAAVSQQSGIHIVAPTGVHLEKYYPPGHWSGTYSVEEMAGLFIADIQEGIDAGDYGGPLLRRTSHRAGVIKVASGKDALTAREEKIFHAAAQAHLATGCPILTHTEQGTAALEQVALFQQAGVHLDHIVLSHLDRRNDPTYHREVLSTGVRVEYDSAFRWKSGEPNITLELLLQLQPEFPDQIMLGMDAARRSYWKSYGGGPGMGYLLEAFQPRLEREGVTPEMLHRIFITTPASAYSFVKNPSAP